ncbi:hypothetical protein B0H13DRAFT_2662545 [Mycena leptocephala]|nr:hypothetical protein B0H13DRAFT_2662545 [Mycena leptocephala]
MTSVLFPTPRRILIVGGGPRGLAALRNLGEKGQFDEVVLAEKRRHRRARLERHHARLARWQGRGVATSWYDFPAWPEDTPGLAEARAAGLATHAQTWHGPVGYGGKRAVVVGNANSSNDIAAQLKPGLRRFAFLPDPRVVDVLPIARSIVKATKKLDLGLLDGSTLTDIDAVVLGTGYSAASAPFVRVLNPPSASATQSQTLTPLTSAHTSPPRIPGLHNYILYAPTPTLAFIGVVMSCAPFTLADVASAWLTLFFAGRLAIPASLPARLAGERERMEKVARHREVGAEREWRELSSLVAYHILGPDEKAYAQGLREAVKAVDPEWAEVLLRWGDEEWTKWEGMYERKWVSLMAEAELEERVLKVNSKL